MKELLTSTALFILVLSGCAPTPTPDISRIDPCAPDVLTRIAPAVAKGAVPACDKIPTTEPPANTSGVTLTAADVLCKDTGGNIGEYVFCKIPNAHCSYQPGEMGSPTFCNDEPYPNHAFTLIVWREDWSDLDGKCIYVDGVISAYDGKPQITATGRGQVLECK